MKKSFYVYEHWRPDLDVCFYVGKGHGKRANDMRRGRNRFHKFIQAKLSSLGMCVEVRLVCDGMEEEAAFLAEIERIAFWRSSGVKLANITDGGDGSCGVKFTDQRKEVQRQNSLGRKHTAASKAKLSSALKGNKNGLGKKKSPEAIAAVIAVHLGSKRSEETCRRISASKKLAPPFKGKTHTLAAIEIIRTKNLGRKRSEETKSKMRKPKSEEHKAKLAAVNLGKRHSDETRARLSELSRQQWAARRLIAQMNAGG